MKNQWYVFAAFILALPCAAIAADLKAELKTQPSSDEMPTEVRTDVQRIYPLGEKFDRKHIAETCTDSAVSHFKCFKSTFDQVVQEREPTVTGYVLLLSIGTVVLAEERQKIIDAGRAESDTEKAILTNTLDTAELLITTLERVAKKANVIKQEKPIVDNLRTTLISRAESVLKQRQQGRTIASIGAVPASGSKASDDRREKLLERLSGLSEVTQ